MLVLSVVLEYCIILDIEKNKLIKDDELVEVCILKLLFLDEVIRVIAENIGAELTIIELDDTGVSDHEKLGYALVDFSYYDILEYLTNDIDYEDIGRDYDFGISRNL